LQNNAVKAKVEEYGGSLIHGRSYHPQSNGGQERAGGTVKTIIRTKLMDQGTNWVAHLNGAIDVYRNTVHSTIKATPNSLWTTAWAKP